MRWNLGHAFPSRLSQKNSSWATQLANSTGAKGLFCFMKGRQSTPRCGKFCWGSYFESSTIQRRCRQFNFDWEFDENIDDAWVETGRCFHTSPARFSIPQFLLELLVFLFTPNDQGGQDFFLRD